MSELVLREDSGGVATLTLNRPDKVNALSGQMFEALDAHLKALARQSSKIGLVILRGAGGNFSSGYDMKEIASAVLQLKPVMNLLHQILEGPPLALSAKVVEGPDDAVHQPSTLEALPSPAECLSLVVPLNEGTVELEVVRDSHLFPEFTAEGHSRWVNRTPAASVDFAVRRRGRRGGLLLRGAARS